MEATAPEVQFSRRIRIIRELDVDDVVIVNLRCCVTQKSFALIHIEGTFRVRIGGPIFSNTSVTLLKYNAFSCSVL